MKNVEIALSQILMPKNDLMIIAGAGVSKARPSNLPTGIDFINSFYDFLSNKDKDLVFEKSIPDLKNHNSLRFETIMSLIEREFAEGTHSLLDCYRECTSFNMNHLLLAALGKLGHIILTTNFDSLIERAYLHDGVYPRTIISDEEFEMEHSVENIYKLHGSLEKYDRTKELWSDTSASIRLTLEQVGQQGYEFAISISKRRFLVEHMKKRTLIVVGYSGHDDFDFCPILINTQSDKKLIWFDYNPEAESIYEGEEVAKSPEKFGKPGQIFTELIRRHLRRKEDCFIVQSDSFRFLDSVVHVLNHVRERSLVEQPEYSINAKAYFAERFDKILPTINSILRMKANLYLRIENYKAGLSLYEELLKSIDNEKDLYIKSKIYHETALCYSNLQPPEYKTALSYAMKSFEIDSANNFASIFVSFDLLARLSKEIGDVRRALEMYDLVLSPKIELNNYFMKYQFAVLLNNYSIILFQLRKMKESVNVARRSASLFRDIGDLDGLVKATFAIVSPLMESGLIDEAINELEKIEKLVIDLGSLQDICVLYNELGIAFRYKGDIEKSIDFHSKAAKYANDLGLSHEVARNLYNIAGCELTRGEIEKAKEFNEKSLELREALPKSLERSKSLSENLQLFGNILKVQGTSLLAEKKLIEGQTKLKDARLAYKKSNEFAEEIQYAQVICDNYSNLLGVAMLLGEDDEVYEISSKLKVLLLEKFDMADRWKEIEIQIQFYRELRKGIKNFVDGLFTENDSNENLGESIRHCKLAIEYYHQKNWSEAEKYFEKAIALDSHNANILYNFAVMTYEKALDTKDEDTMRLAANRYEELLKFTPDDVEALVNLAVIYMNNDSIGKFDRAKELLDHAIKINPNYGLGWLNLGQFYSFRGGGKSLISASDEISQSKLDKADVMFNLNDLKIALNFFDRAFKLDSSLILKFHGLRDSTEIMIKMIEEQNDG